MVSMARSGSSIPLYAQDSSGLKRFSMNLTANNIRRFQRSSGVLLLSRHGDGDWPTIRLSTRTSRSSQKRCLLTAFKTFTSQPGFLILFKLKTIQCQLSVWSTNLRWRLIDKLDQAFLLMWMQLLISWMIYEERKRN